MLPRTWSAANRVEHPPLMVSRLLATLHTTKAWRDAISLGGFVARKAVESKMIAAPSDPQTCRALGIPSSAAPARGRRRGRPALSDEGPGSALVPLDTSAGALTVSQAAPSVARVDILDCTFGSGHHSRALLQGGDPFTRVVALDSDPAAAPVGRALEAEAGPQRFRFIGAHMSAAARLFGEEAFDVVVVDPGPSATQLFDPVRGFPLDGGNHSLDMRYSPRTGTSALHWLNCEDSVAAATALAKVGMMHFNEALRLVKGVRAHRPLQGSLDVLSVLEHLGGPLPEDGWVATTPERRLPPSMRFLLSLRAVVNREQEELAALAAAAMVLLRKNGTLIAFPRYQFERECLKAALDAHPYCVPLHSEYIDRDDVQEYGFPPSTQLCAFRRSKAPAALLRNAVHGVAAEDVTASAFARMSGLDSTVPQGFPAQNFTFTRPDRDERAVRAANAAAPVPEESLRDIRRGRRGAHS